MAPINTRRRYTYARDICHPLEGTAFTMSAYQYHAQQCVPFPHDTAITSNPLHSAVGAPAPVQLASKNKFGSSSIALLTPNAHEHST